MAIGHLAKPGYPFLYTILPIRESNRWLSVQTLLTEESNRRLSVQTPSDRSIDHALVAWQSGILQSRGAHFLYAILSAEESNRRFSVCPPSDHSIDHALVAWQSGIL